MGAKLQAKLPPRRRADGGDHLRPGGDDRVDHAGDAVGPLDLERHALARAGEFRDRLDGGVRAQFGGRVALPVRVGRRVAAVPPPSTSSGSVQTNGSKGSPTGTSRPNSTDAPGYRHSTEHGGRCSAGTLMSVIVTMHVPADAWTAPGLSRRCLPA